MSWIHTEASKSCELHIGTFATSKVHHPIGREDLQGDLERSLEVWHEPGRRAFPYHNHPSGKDFRLLGVVDVGVHAQGATFCSSSMENVGMPEIHCSCTMRFLFGKLRIQYSPPKMRTKEEPVHIHLSNLTYLHGNILESSAVIAALNNMFCTRLGFSGSHLCVCVYRFVAGSILACWCHGRVGFGMCLARCKLQADRNVQFSLLESRVYTWVSGVAFEW